MVSVLGCGILFSPMGQAMFEGLFQVSKFEKSAHNEEISFVITSTIWIYMKSISMVF